jgi:hypothetical protein
MANSNFVVHNGLTVGPTTITASTGNINAGNISSTGSITAVSISATTAALTNVTISGTVPSISANTINVSTATIAGNLTITGNGSRILGDFTSTPQSNRLAFQTSIVDGTTTLGVLPNGAGATAQIVASSSSDATNTARARLTSTTTEAQLSADAVGTGNLLPLSFYTNNAAQVTLDTRGNLVVVGSGLLGYGIGSGGNIVQATSKTTAVTLNKSAGRITTANTSMGTGASIFFTLNNTQISANDVVVLNASGRNGAYLVTTQSVHTGNANVRIVNVTAGTLAETVDINFAVIKTTQS